MKLGLPLIPFEISENISQLAKLLSTVIQTSYHVREGTTFEKGVALVNCGISVIEFVDKLKGNEATKKIFNMGYTEAIPNYVEFWSKLIVDQDGPYHIRRSPFPYYSSEFIYVTPYGYSEPQFVFWTSSDSNSSKAIYHRASFNLREFLSELIWMKGSQLELSTLARQSPRDYDSIQFVPIKKQGDYVGSPTPEEVASQLILDGTRTRSVLLAGASGNGKSTLAYKIGEYLCPENSRVLKISGKFIRTSNSPIALIQVLQPTVLLLDDIPIQSLQEINGMLDLLDSLQGKTKLIVSTFMEDHKSEEDVKKPGGLYWPGMRPGRIDSVVWVSKPDKVKCRKILELSLPTDFPDLDSIAEDCVGLTCAYVAEIGFRLKARAPQVDWKTEVNLVKQAAPK